MVLKNSEEYDSILHVGADMDFIDQVFTLNIRDLENAKLQLFGLYAKEYESNLQNSATNREKSLASVLNNRNLALIEREYSVFRIKQIERANVGSQQLSIQDALDKAELTFFSAENNLSVEEKNMSLLRVASSTESATIWGKERDTWIYQQEFERKYAKSEDDKVLIIEELKTNLEMAQIQLNDFYSYAKEQTVNSQNNLDEERKR